MSDRLPRPEPRDAFKRALRAQLMAQAAGALAPRETAWSRFRRGLHGGWMRPALVAASIVAVLLGGATKAAADSLPGDTVFGLKRAAEQVQLAFALDDSTRLRLLAEQADHRLAELAEAVSGRPQNAPVAEDEYAAAVRTLTVAVDAMRGRSGASDDQRIEAEDVVDAAHVRHQKVLDDLSGKSSPSQQGEIERAKESSDRLHASDRPARTGEPGDDAERTRSPQPARTSSPTRAADATRAPEQKGSPDDSGSSDETSAPQATRSPDPTRSLRTPSPSPSPRR